MTSTKARRNRRNPTEPEVRLSRHLSNAQLGGYGFRRQHPIGHRIRDVFSASIALGVEIDGDTHDAAADRIRDAWPIDRHGIIVPRFSNLDVMTTMAGAHDIPHARARGPAPRWPSTGVLHRDPSFEGVGLSS